MASIQDHGVRPVRRGTPSQAYYTGDPQTLVELTSDDEMLGVYFDYLAYYYGASDDMTITGRRNDNGSK